MHDFGVVAEHGDCFEFHIDAAGGMCRLIAIVHTERGPRRIVVADIAGSTWRKISQRAVRELALGMDEGERLPKKAPSLKTGVNRLSPLIGRELALLLWVLQEEGALEQLEAILHGWRELAREERWWLYAKAATPGQRMGVGWRRALFHALSEVAETRDETPVTEKKSLQKVHSPHSSSSPRSASLQPIPNPPQPNPVARKSLAAAAVKVPN